MFWTSKKKMKQLAAEELRIKLRRVLYERYVQNRNIQELQLPMDQWSEGYLRGQEELFGEIINVLDGTIQILDPVD